MSTPTVFAQIRKVDEEKRLVFGRAAEEAVDKADEIMDYMSSKPHFEKWSADIAADSGGKNLGNVRAMHGKVAAGALTELHFDDAGKAIDVVAKVVDDGEWKKVLAGVYTGFSIGGSYVGDRKVEKVDGREVRRYTAKPTEISLVDRPCMPGAKFFDVQKADGSLVKVDFAAPQPEVPDVEVRGSAEEIEALGKLMLEQSLSVADVIAKISAPAAVAVVVVDAPKGDEAAKAEATAALEKVEAAEADVALTAVEKAFADFKPALAKIGARNSAADKARLAAIHESVVGLGHDCDGDNDAGKATAAEGLQKIDGLEKLVADAVAPLQKLLDEATVKITKLEAQPASPIVRLRAITKGEDMAAVDTPAAVAKVVDAAGQESESASLIKQLHAQGGVSLHLPRVLR